jgi:hypothetical protein
MIIIFAVCILFSSDINVFSLHLVLAKSHFSYLLVALKSYVCKTNIKIRMYYCSPIFLLMYKCFESCAEWYLERGQGFWNGPCTAGMACY